MARRVVKYDPDAGIHPEAEVDVQAVVIRWDSSLKALIVDTGSIHPAIAAAWLYQAWLRVDLETVELLGDALMEDE